MNKPRRAATLTIRDNSISVIQVWSPARGWNHGYETFYYRRRLVEGGRYTGPVEGLKTYREAQRA